MTQTFGFQFPGIEKVVQISMGQKLIQALTVA